MANITQLINNIRNAVFGKDVRESIASAIEQTYEDASEHGNANMEVVDARGTFDTLKKRLDNSDSVKANNTKITDLQLQINELASGSPLVASSTSEMTDTTKVYVNTTDGKWYYYNGSAWAVGGIYLASSSDTFLNRESINSVKNSTINEYVDFLEVNSNSKGIKLSLSNLKLKYDSILPVKFENGSLSNGTIDKNENSTRAISKIFSLSGTLYIYNFNNVKYDILELDENNSIIRRLNQNYSLIPYTTFTCNNNYKYVFLIANENLSSIVSENDRINAEKNLYIFMDPLTDEKSIKNKSNLFNNLIAGYYVDYNNGQLKANNNMVVTNLTSVNNREYLYTTNTYIQLAFYDYQKNYISGHYFNPNSAPNSPFQKIEIPNDAFYMRASSRAGNEKTLIISENIIPTLNNNYVNLSDIVPKHLVKKSSLNKYYDYDFSKNVSSDELFKSSSITKNDSGLFLQSNNYVVYKKNISPDKSIILFNFACEEDSVLNFGTDISSYNTIAEGGLKIIVDTNQKTMKVYASNWIDSNTLKQETNFEFNITDGDEYCLQIIKSSIYDIQINLFNAKCPNEVAKIVIKTEKNEENINVSNIARVWGCGRAQVVSGSMTLMKMSMYVSSNRYPKIFIIGDSYIENHSRPYNHSYARQIYDLLNGNVTLSGGGGNTSTVILNRLINEIPYIHPEYCIVNTGVNDRNISEEQYISNMNNMINILEELKITPILVTCPRVMDNDNLSVMTYINEYVRNSGYNYIDLAFALSSGDGVTMDETKYQSDKVHPNAKGANAIIKYIESNLPELLI